MDANELFDQLIPLFKQKMELSIEKERMIQNGTFITPEQKNASRLVDLEYSKLENQIKNDKDKLAWEKEKTFAGFDHGLDLADLHNQGLVNVATINNAGQKEVAEIKARSDQYGYDSKVFSSALDASKNIKTKDAMGVETSQTGSPLANTIGTAMAKKLGYAPTAEVPTERPVGHDATYIQSLNTSDPTGKTAATFYKGLSPTRQAELAPLLGIQSQAPAAAVAQPGKSLPTATGVPVPAVAPGAAATSPVAFNKTVDPRDGYPEGAEYNVAGMPLPAVVTPPREMTPNEMLTGGGGNGGAIFNPTNDQPASGTGIVKGIVNGIANAGDIGGPIVKLATGLFQQPTRQPVQEAPINTIKPVVGPVSNLNATGQLLINKKKEKEPYIDNSGPANL